MKAKKLTLGLTLLIFVCLMVAGHLPVLGMQTPVEEEPPKAEQAPLPETGSGIDRWTYEPYVFTIEITPYPFFNRDSKRGSNLIILILLFVSAIATTCFLLRRDSIKLRIFSSIFTVSILLFTMEFSRWLIRYY